MLKHLTTLFASLLLLFSLALTTHAYTPPLSFFSPALETLSSRNILPSSFRFSPSAPVSRGDFLAYLIRALGEQDTALSLLQTKHLSRSHWYADYPDVRVGESYAPAVTWAHSRGLIQGYPDGTFRPHEPLTHAAALKLVSLTFLADSPASSSTPTPYQNLDRQAWYYPFVLRASSANLFPVLPTNNGLAPTTFSPGASLTQAEMVLLLERCLYLNPLTAYSLTSEELTFTATPTSPTQIKITFPTTVSSEAFSSSSYSIRSSSRKSLNIKSLKKINSHTVLLTTSPQTPTLAYTLTLDRKITSQDETLSLHSHTYTFYGHTESSSLLTVTLDPDFQKKSSALPSQAEDITFLKLKLENNSPETLELSSLIIRTRGLNSGDSFKNPKAYFNGSLVSERKSFSSNRTATLRFRPTLTLRPSTTHTLSLTADLVGSAPSRTTYALEIPSSDSFTFFSPAPVQGSFPLRGPEFRRYGVSTGSLSYTYQDLQDPLTLGEENDLLRFSLSAQTEDILIRSIKFKNLGSLDPDYLSDLSLRLSSRRRYSPQIDGRYITFDFSDNPYTVERNTRIPARLIGEINAGSGQTIEFIIDEISASGETYGYGVTSSRSISSSNPTSQPVSGHALSLRAAPDNPRGYTLYAGESRQTIAKFELETYGSDLTLENLSFDLHTQNFEDFSFSELSVYLGGRKIGEFIPSSYDSTQTFELDGPFTLPANRIRNLTFKAEFFETFSEEEATLQIFWNPLTSSSLNFRAERSEYDERLSRSEVSPSSSLTLSGGLFRLVSED